MLREFKDLWQGQLGSVTVTEHRIDLAPGASPSTSTAQSCQRCP